MLDRGLTEDGAAQALGWPKVRITARVKILELPERAQEMIGAGVIALSAVDQLRAIGRVSPPLLEAVVAFLADGNEWAAERLAREPGWVLDSALREGSVKAFAAYMSYVGSREIGELRLGKKTEDLYAEAEKLHKQFDRYAYGPPQIRFNDDDVDQARAVPLACSISPRRRSHDPHRPDPPGVLQRPSGQAAPRKPPHDRLLPRHAEPALAFRAGHDRHRAVGAGLGRARRARDRRVPCSTWKPSATTAPGHGTSG